MNDAGVQEFISALDADTIFVGFSGGADSTALLILLDACASHLGFDLHAVHFQHNLRGQASMDDAQWCREFCSARKVEFKQVDLDVSGKQRSGEGIEAAARRLRNDYWQQYAGGQNCYVALGHHAGDRAENLFLRLCRGSNVTGLTSMRAVQQIGYVAYVRPLLQMSRSEIVCYLDECGINDWRHDASNDDDSYKRNFIRHTIVPELYSAFDYAQAGLQQSLSTLSDDADFIESEALSRFQSIKGLEKVEVPFFKKLHRAVFVRVLRYWLNERLGREFLPNRRLIERLEYELSRDGVSCEMLHVPLNGDTSLVIHKGAIRICSEDTVVKPPESVLWNWEDTPRLEWNGCILDARICSSIPTDTSGLAIFEESSLPEVLTVRSWKAGDAMTPFGRKTPVKLKKLFSDRKISADKKNKYPLVCDAKEILWIPEVRRSNCYPAVDSPVVVISATFPD